MASWVWCSSAVCMISGVRLCWRRVWVSHSWQVAPFGQVIHGSALSSVSSTEERAASG